MSGVAYLLLLACLAVAAVPLYGRVTGRSQYLPVLSGSMAPKMVRGDLAVVEPKHLSELRVGDVLVFNSPERAGIASRRVIHRVVEILDPAQIKAEQVRPGTVFIRTKGDANPDVDPWIAAVSTETVWVRSKIIPKLGWLTIAMGAMSGQTVGLFAGALLLAGLGYQSLRQGAKPSPSPPPAIGRSRPQPPPWAAGSAHPLPVRRLTLAEATWPSRPPVTWSSRPAGHDWRPAAAAATAPEPGLRSSLVVGAISVLVVGLAGAGAAVTAALTDSVRFRGAGVSAGAVSLQIGDSTLPVTASDVYPGERIEGVITLRNVGETALGSISLKVEAPSGPLSQAAEGLQLSIDRCPVPWQDVTGADGERSAQCTAASTTIVAGRPLVARTQLDPAALDSVAPGGFDHLRFTIRLPDTAPPSLAGQSTTITIEFSGGQQGGSLR
jgi:signal peptidase I